ncbi:MAG TPA: Hsp20 family protein, partial [Candidatus Faecivicinus avistercoris]|nr:Hsp20 family protein [Candidatus Faecivicinus avistercoris]
RRYGRSSRSFNLDGIEENGITAEFKDGVLKLTLPKEKAQQKLSGRTIEIQ